MGQGKFREQTASDQAMVFDPAELACLDAACACGIIGQSTSTHDEWQVAAVVGREEEHDDHP